MKTNVVLIGMPGCGKSTIGVLLAKSMLLDFIDTDLVLQNQYGKTLCEMIDNWGIEIFLERENSTIASLRQSNCVIATGGSAVYGEEAMQKLKAEGTVVYLSLPVKEIERRIHNIETRGIAMPKGSTIEALFRERSPLYKQYADITIDCSGFTPEGCVNQIILRLKQNR